MDPRTIIVIGAIVIVLLIVIWAVMRKRQRTVALRQNFGPEYDRAVREHGTHGEEVLIERQKRVEKFSLRALSADEREHFISEWRVVQSRFVDDPAGAVREADTLVTRLMQSRGYPMTDFEQRAADISVHYPRVVENYRAAHEIALRHQRGEASTEDFRNSMIYYRKLFDELLETNSERVTVKREVA